VVSLFDLWFFLFSFFLFYFFFSLQKKGCSMQALLAQLKSLPPAVHGTIRFFDRKDFFSVYGEDAEFVADTFNKTRATVKYLSAGEGGGAGLASQTVTARLLPDMLKKLVRELNLSFEIWGQKQGGWELTSKGSPGNFDEGEFGGDEDEANIGPGLMAALHVGKDASGLTVVGIAVGILYSVIFLRLICLFQFVDVLRSCIGLTQFTDVDTLANAETALVQLGCSECVVPKSGARGSSPSLPQMLARADIAATERQSKDFAGGAPLFSELQRLLDPVKEKKRKKKKTSSDPFLFVFRVITV
jgi:DNA mismatch repair protein MSH2